MQRQELAQTVTFTVTCPTCGDQDLRASALHLTVFDHGRNSFYSFFCPGCTEEVRHRADIDVLIVLCQAEVACTEIHVPDECLDPARSGPPISSDDVMDFVVALREHDEFYWM